MTERLHFRFSLSRIGEGHGSPLQRSCLESPGAGSLGGCRLWGRAGPDAPERRSSSRHACACVSNVQGHQVTGPRVRSEDRQY